MFKSDINYSKLKTNLRLAENRLKLLEKKKTEQAQKSRKEIADYIAAGKYERARVRVEQIIREDYMVEGLELVELYCDLLLSRFGLLQQNKVLDTSLQEAVSSLIWASPRLESEVSELKIVSDLLSQKYGKVYAESCRSETVDTISEKLKHKLGVQPPPKILVEKYLIEISKNYSVQYEPDSQVLKEYELSKGVDGMLFDNVLINDLDNKDAQRPTGFIGYPQPLLPPYPSPQFYVPPNPIENACPLNTNVSQSLPSSAFNVPPPNNINSPPSAPDEKISNINVSQKSLSSSNSKDLKTVPKSITSAASNFNMPELPTVPTEAPTGEVSNVDSAIDDVDFDDLAKRFEELKKRK